MFPLKPDDPPMGSRFAYKMIRSGRFLRAQGVKLKFSKNATLVVTHKVKHVSEVVFRGFYFSIKIKPLCSQANASSS